MIQYLTDQITDLASKLDKKEILEDGQDCKDYAFNVFLRAVERQLDHEHYIEFDQPIPSTMHHLAHYYITEVANHEPWKDVLGDVFYALGLQDDYALKFNWDDAMIYASKNVSAHISPECDKGLKTVVGMEGLSGNVLLANIATITKQGEDLSLYRLLSIHTDLRQLRVTAVQVLANTRAFDITVGEILIAQKTELGLNALLCSTRDGISPLLHMNVPPNNPFISTH